jgi:hypothetical protein
VKKIFTLMLGMAFLMVSAAQAGVIVLKNGDRITGDIKAIWDGDVVIEPDYADEFTVDQDDIAYIESDKPFELEYKGEDMVTRTAIFKGADEEGNQIVELDGEDTVVPMMKIGEVDEVEDFFDWSINGDLNAEINRGNTDSTEVALTSDWYLKYGKQKHFFDTLWVKEENEDPDTGNDVTTEDRQRYRYNLNYDIGDPWFTGAYGSYEKDEIKGLKYRYSAVPTLGYKVWDNAGKSLNIQAGYGYEGEETEDNNGVREDDGGGIALLVIKANYDFPDPDLSLYANNTTTKAQYGRDNVVNQLNAGVRFEITDLLYFNVETFYDYESEAVAGAEKDDLKILIGIGLEFDK